MEARWYSGKYDSMKQRDCRLACVSEDSFMRRYAATMRLEWFFTGKLVVTDAQWYDGTYFKNLCAEPDFEHFINFAEKSNFEIKEREDYSMSMVAGGFEYSSVFDTDLSAAFDEINEELKYIKKSDPDQFRLIASSPVSYTDFLESFINKEYSSAMCEFDKFKNAFLRLQFIEGRKAKQRPSIFSGWTNRNSIPDVMAMCNEKLIKSILEGARELAVVQPYKAYEKPLNCILDQLGKSYPQRGEIVKAINRLNALAGKRGVSNERFKVFLNRFNFYYNYALARQHTRESYDGSDLNSAAEERIMNLYEMHDSLINIEVPGAMDAILGNLSWEAFDDMLAQNRGIMDEREKWLDSYNVATINPTSGNVDSAKNNLRKYIDVLANSIEGLRKYVLHNYAVLDRGETPGIYIAGGSDLDCLFGDSLLVLCGQGDQNGKLVCMNLSPGAPDPVVTSIITRGDAMISLASKVGAI